MLDIIGRLDHLLEFLSITISYRRVAAVWHLGASTSSMFRWLLPALSGHN